MSVSQLLFACHTVPSLEQPQQRRVLKLDLSTRKLHMYKKNEQRDCATIPFNDILCVVENVKYPHGLSIYTNGYTSAWPLNVFMDSNTDRNDFVNLVQTCASGKHMKDTFVNFGTRYVFEFKAKKKGGLTAKTRILRLQNYHVNIYNRDSDATPSNVLSLMKVTFEASTDVANAIELKFQENKRVFQLGSPDDVKRAIQCMMKMKREHFQRLEQQKQMAEEPEVASRPQARSSHSKDSSKASPNESPHTPPVSPPTASHTPPSLVPINTPILATTLREVNVKVGNQWVTLGPNTMVEIAKQQKVKDRHDGNIAMSFHLISPYKGICVQEKEPLFRLVNQQKQAPPKPKTKLSYYFPLNEFVRAFKPGRHQATITYWGKDHGSAKNRKVPLPAKISSLSELKLVSLSLPSEGMHGFGITQECWVYVFGETAAPPTCNPLGLEQKLTAYRPTRISALANTKIVQICGSEHHSLALSNDGKVFGWGSSALTSLPVNSSSPKLIEDLSQLDIAGIAACNTHSAIWTNSGRLYTFGNPGNWLGYDWSKAYYQGNTNPMGEVIFPPLNVKGKFHVQKVTVCTTHTLVLFDNGLVASFGNNDHGQLGIGTTQSSMHPRFVALPKCGDIACGSNFSIFLTQNGQIYSCGHTYHGHGHDRDLYEPVCIESLRKAKFARVSAGNECVYAITEVGCTVMWGRYSGTKMDFDFGGNAELVKQPKVLQTLRAWRIYDIGIGADFSMALGVLVNKIILATDLPSNADEEAKFLQNYNVPPAANQASRSSKRKSTKKIVVSSVGDSTSPTDSKTVSQSRSRFSRSPSHPDRARVRAQHQSGSPTRRKIRRVSASPAPNYQNKFRPSHSPNSRRIPQNPMMHKSRAGPSKSPFDVRRHTVGAHISPPHPPSNLAHLQPSTVAAHHQRAHRNPNQHPVSPPTVGTYSRVSRSRTPGPPLDTRRLIRRRKSEHRDPREAANQTKEPVRNVSYSDNEEENKSDEDTSDIYGKGSFDFTHHQGAGIRRDTAYSEYSNATSYESKATMLGDDITPRHRLRADTTYTDVSMGKSYSETRAELLFPEPAQVKSQSVSFVDDVEIHQPPKMSEVKKSDPSAKRRRPPAAPAEFSARHKPSSGGGMIPPSPPVKKAPPPAPPDVIRRISKNTPSKNLVQTNQNQKQPPVKSINVNLKRIPSNMDNDPNAVNTPPPPPDAVKRRPRMGDSSMSLSNSDLGRQRVNTVPAREEEFPESGPTMSRNKSTPIQRSHQSPPPQPTSTPPPTGSISPAYHKVQQTQTLPPSQRMSWRQPAPSVDLSTVPAPPPVPFSGGAAPSPAPRNSSKMLFRKRKSTKKRGPDQVQTQEDTISKKPTSFRRARKKQHFYAPVQPKNGGARALRQAKSKTNQQSKPLVAPPKLSSKHKFEGTEDTPKEIVQEQRPSRVRANTRIEEVLDGFE